MQHIPERHIDAVLLKKVPLFAEFSDSDLVAVASLAQTRRYAKHAVLVYEGDPGDALFVGDTWGPDVEGPLAAGITPAYLERPGHWPDATRPADISHVPVARIRDLAGVVELVESD